MVRLASGDQQSRVRSSGSASRNRTPSRSSATGRFAGPVRGGAARSARMRPSSSQLAAYVQASKRNGAHRVTAYSAAPSGPPTRPATCWRACCWERAVGRSSSGTTVRTAEHLGRREEPGAGPGEQRDGEEVRDRQRPGHAGRDQRRVEQHAGAAGRAHEPQPVRPVGEHPGGQQHRDHPEQVQRLGRRGEQRRTGQRVGEEREDEHAHPAPELAEGLADPQGREVVVAGEAAVAGHIRNITCATCVAQ